jgi:alpha-methylacyl-CoA racemase
LNDSDDITKEVLEKKFKEKTRAEWTLIFDSLDACVSPVLELDEAPHYKHNKERNAFIRTADKSNWLPAMNWMDNDSNNCLDMPNIGQHTEHILKNLGYTEKQIDNLIKEKIVEADNTKHLSSKL